jgi:hypothetical protein
MDEIILPDEDEHLDDMTSNPFKRMPVSSGSGDFGFETASKKSAMHPSGVDASDYVKITFARFVALVANHSFVDVIQNSQEEEVILSANLLTDLANSRRFVPNTKGPLMVLGGVLFGILMGYFLFKL